MRPKIAGDPAVGPHKFRPLGRFRNKNKCRHCFAPKEIHPMDGWSVARPYGDKS